MPNTDSSHVYDFSPDKLDTRMFVKTPCFYEALEFFEGK
jgi:hypothetical protein